MTRLKPYNPHVRIKRVETQAPDFYDSVDEYVAELNKELDEPIKRVSSEGMPVESMIEQSAKIRR